MHLGPTGLTAPSSLQFQVSDVQKRLVAAMGKPTTVAWLLLANRSSVRKCSAQGFLYPYTATLKKVVRLEHVRGTAGPTAVTHSVCTSCPLVQS